MSKTKFTPGPWMVDDVGYVIGPKGDDDLVASPHGLANARLIAAAPEMYAYLTKVESIVLRIREHLPSGAISVVEHCLTDLDAHAFDLLQKIEGTDETSK